MNHCGLITFSGSVGTGKSTNAKAVVSLLREMGLGASYIRFRKLGCREPGENARTGTARAKREGRAGATRRVRPSIPLTAPRVLGYLYRIVRFRLFLARYPADHWAVVDRYFYDSLAGYQLKGRREMAYVRLLEAAMPRPKMAFLLMTSPGVLAYRRRSYPKQRLESSWHGYRKVQRLFPSLVSIDTDDLSGVDAEIRLHIDRMFDRHDPPAEDVSILLSSGESSGRPGAQHR